MMIKRAFACLAMSLATIAANAMPITATVTVGDREWAQPNLFTGLRSWNDIAAQCPTTGATCDGGELNGFDLTGWIWASRDDVAELFAATTDYVDGPDLTFGLNSLVEVDSDWAPAFFSEVGFESDNPGGLRVGGFTSTSIFDFVAVLGFVQVQAGSVDGSDSLADFVGFFEPPQTDRLLDVGVWFYRPAVSVPEPATAPLIGLALTILFWRRLRSGQQRRPRGAAVSR
jgi:hypothetical protein